MCLAVIYNIWSLMNMQTRGPFPHWQTPQQGEPCPSRTDCPGLWNLTSEALAAGQFPCLPARWAASRQRLLAASGAGSEGLSGPSPHRDAPSMEPGREGSPAHHHTGTHPPHIQRSHTRRRLPQPQTGHSDFSCTWGTCVLVQCDSHWKETLS